MAAAEAALAGVPKPTVAFISGDCIGGGCSIAIDCDIRIATSEARFGITPANLGIVYPSGALERAAHLLGPAVTKRLLFTGDLMSVAEAHRVGLVDEVVDVEVGEERLATLTGVLASRSLLTQAATKSMIWRSSYTVTSRLPWWITGAMSPQLRLTVQKESQRSSRSASPASRGRAQMASRASRRIERSLPWPAMALAGLAVGPSRPASGRAHQARAPWGHVGTILRAPSVREALRLSIICSLCATIVSVVLGLPLAWLLARKRFAGRWVVRALCTLSMVLPPVVGGVALLFALGRRGLVGQYLDRWFDIRLPFTSAAVVIAQTFVAMPFFVVTVEAALRQTDVGHDDVLRVPSAPARGIRSAGSHSAIRPALIAGAVLSWARAFGEFGATITFAGSFPGKTQTLPLSVYLTLDTAPKQAIVLALVMVAVSFAVLVALRDRWLGGGERT